jgi:hypothetical protein
MPVKAVSLLVAGLKGKLLIFSTASKRTGAAPCIYIRHLNITNKDKSVGVLCSLT